jgi:hypothetical protein
VSPIKRALALLALAACAGGVVAGSADARAIGAYTTKAAWSFVSAPSVHPPKLHTDRRTAFGKLASGYFLAANTYNLNSSTPMVGQGGPLILDSRLRPVWFQPIGTKALAFNLQQQSYQGQPVLTWWQGVVSNVGVTVSGEDVVVDQHYHQLATVTGKGGWVVSLHDFVLSGPDAWVTAYKTVTGVDLTPYGGPANGTVLDTAVQEYDLKTGQLLFSWDALNPGKTPNVPLSQSKQPAPKSSGTAWDAYHLNSLQVVGGNQVLVSMRNTWAAYLVNVGTGAIGWTLSGNPRISTFSLPSNARFHWQHHVVLHAGNLISVYDDACCANLGKGNFSAPNGPSRGLELKLDMTKHTGSLVAQFTHGKGFDSAFLGSMEPLPSGNAVVGWGSLPYFSEFNGSGKLLLDAVWPTPDLSYRVLFSNWVGMPSSPPSGAVRKSHGKTYVYASWNGATQVLAWRVLAGSSSQHLSVVVSRAARTGFETTIPVPGSHKTFEVQALGSHSAVLGTSKAFGRSSPALIGAY